MSSVGFLANLSQNIALIWWLLIIRVTGVVFEQAIPIKMLLPILSSSKGQSDLAMNEQEILAVIRTLLALERNYLAVERTQLAQLRTGLTLGLIGPPATAPA